jgi:crotonobetainyl-CoA:carnitine CoA-transferase CaiB-like acyl-CoA transferase
MVEQPLTGVRVVDLSRMVSGPLCGRILADLGADVVKVEPPEGDRTRTVPPFIDGLSPYFAQMNAGKRDVCVDLKAAGGAEAVARLAARADVFIENFRPGVLARYGLDAPTLTAQNPRLVYCSVTGWGQAGVGRDRRAFAPLVHAEIGTLEFAARHRGRRPEPEVHQHGDVYPAILAANAVLAALLQRANTGCGQHLDVAMGEAAFYVNEWAAVSLQPPVDEFAGFDTWNQYTYRLGDGSSVALVGDPVTAFPMWLRGLGGDPSVLDDPRFADAEARAAHVTELNDETEHMTQRFADFAALETAVDEPWMLMAPVRSTAEFARTDWATARGVTTDVAPGVPVPAAPWRSDAGAIGSPSSAPALGADNEAVLAEVGYSPEEIDELRRGGALSGGGSRS